MKKIILFMTFAITVGSVIAQQKTAPPSKYDVVVVFGSMAIGPASPDFLKTFLKSFTKKCKITIPAYLAAGCGREGEFNILLSTVKLKSSTKLKFLNDLKLLVAKEEKKNKLKNESSGNISIEYNKNAEDFSFCRDGIMKW
ncbi:MAG: hypothetical protein ABIO05_02910 [Ferruginibacter sp.]